ncbi:hypothetical protein HC928_08520 [bacterium]|nr:hypothetical protein [bacterium]
MSTDSRYYSTEGGGDYKAFVDHFKRQAEGAAAPVMLNTRHIGRSFRNARAGRARLVLVDTKKDQGTTKKGELTGKLEIVDPNEAERRRALSEAAREEVAVDKERQKATSAHSAIGKRQRQSTSQAEPTAAKRQRSAIAVAKSRVKRVKDIFDE